MLDSDTVVREFKQQSLYNLYFRTNTLTEGRNALICLAIVFPQRWILYELNHEDWYAIKQRNQTIYRLLALLKIVIYIKPQADNVHRVSSINKYTLLILISYGVAKHR